MLTPLIKERIEIKFGTRVRYSKDAELLALAISKECKAPISGSSIKRLFGIVKGVEPRKSTLDIIATYLGYRSWDDLIDELTENKVKKKIKIERITSDGCKKGDTYEILFGRSCMLTLQYLGKNRYEVIHQSKTVLAITDSVELEKIQLHFPLLIKTIVRGEFEMDGVTIGHITGVTEIKPLNKIRNRQHQAIKSNHR